MTDAPTSPPETDEPTSPPAKETAEDQIDRLAQFITEHVPGEPSQSEGAVDTAIRLLDDYKQYIETASWTCEIGPIEKIKIPEDGDQPLRAAVMQAFYEMFGETAATCSSGWGTPEGE